jgi:hypothetical protein
MSVYIKRTERSQINDLMLHLKCLENKEQAKFKPSRREIIKMCAEINERPEKKTHKKTMKLKAVSLKK